MNRTWMLFSCWRGMRGIYGLHRREKWQIAFFFAAMALTQCSIEQELIRDPGETRGAAYNNGGSARQVGARIENFSWEDMGSDQDLYQEPESRSRDGNPEHDDAAQGDSVPYRRNRELRDPAADDEYTQPAQNRNRKPRRKIIRLDDAEPDRDRDQKYGNRRASAKRQSKRPVPFRNTRINTDPESEPVSYRRYQVRRGDTLYKIGRRFSISPATIKKINGLGNRNISIGQMLKIPVPAAVRERKRSKPKADPRPPFQWPLNTVSTINRDGRDGVKSLGILIGTRQGAAVRSSAPGVVKKIGIMRGYGKYIVLLHQRRYISIYANLESIVVHEGESVEGCKTIGRLGPHDSKLHFQINCAGKPANPLALLPKKRKG